MKITREKILKREFEIRVSVKMLMRYLQQLGMEAEAKRLWQIYETFDEFFFSIKNEVLKKAKEVEANAGKSN